MTVSDIKQLIELYIDGEGGHRPLAVLVSSFEVKMELIKYLECADGARRINDLLTMGAAQYFDDEGNLIEDIAQRQQLLADGSKYPATEYLDARVKEYDNPDIRVLFDVLNVLPKPDMLGMSRHIADKTGKRLVVIAPVPPKSQDSLYAPFETIVCE